MKPERWHQIQNIFNSLLERPADQREAYLEQACAHDPSLRREVASLLVAFDETGPIDDLAEAFIEPLLTPLHHQTLRAGQTIQHYRLLDQLGYGGMGVVYKAHDQRLDRTVALKFLPPPLSADAQAKRRFLVEARAAAALEHPNICTIHEIGETEPAPAEAGGQLFIVMPCYDGETLKEKIARGPLPLDEALTITTQIAEGLAKAHERGIVHRDVKPANVFVTRDGVVKLLDFGLAKLSTVALTKTGAQMGTVAYMSPEQARGEAVDARTDVWSLGVVVYEMLGGRRPFAGTHEQAILYAILNVEPALLSAYRPDVPEGVVRCVARALAKDRADRYPSVGALLDDLGAISEGGEIAEPPGDRESVRSIAVLPFADMSPEHDQDYLCDGIAEELINVLTRVDTLRVTSRTSSFQFKQPTADIREIGRLLNASAILEGSVRKAGNRLRVTVQLSNAVDGYHLWSERYDREVEDIFAIQDEIAARTLQALQGVLTDKDERALPKAPTADIEAYEYYLRGRQFLYQKRLSGFAFARQLFNRAIEIDPGYAPAYAATTVCCYFLFMWFGQSEADLQEAISASSKAVDLAPDLAESHVARGLALTLAQRHDEAKDALEQAVRLNPKLFDANYLYARICFMQGNLERAETLFRQAAAVDPQDYQAPGLLAQVYESLGRADAALAQYQVALARAERHLELNPDQVRPRYLGGIMLIQLGQKERGLSWVRRALAMEPDDPFVVWNTACAYAVAGELDEALDCLEKARALGISNRGWLEHDPDMDPLRDTPRFQALLQTMQ